MGGVHWREKAADRTYTEASDIANASGDLRRSVVTTLVSHGGLTVSAVDLHALDLPQAYSRKGVQYVGTVSYTHLTLPTSDLV